MLKIDWLYDLSINQSTYLQRERKVLGTLNKIIPSDKFFLVERSLLNFPSPRPLFPQNNVDPLSRSWINRNQHWIGEGEAKTTTTICWRNVEVSQDVCLELQSSSSRSWSLVIFSSEIIKIMRRLCFQWPCCATKYSAKGKHTNFKGRAASVVPVVFLQQMLYKCACRPLF